MYKEAIPQESAKERSVNDDSDSLYRGATDVLVIRQSDGSLKSTPLQVRVGKLSNLFTTLKPREGMKGLLFVNGDEVLFNNEVEFILGASGDILISRNESTGTSGNLTDRDLQKMNLKEGINKAKLVFGDVNHEQVFNIYLYDQTFIV